MPLSPYEEELLQEDDNPYRQTLREQRQSQEVELRKAAAKASGRTPQRQAQLIDLSKRTGLPADLVDRNFDAVQKRADVASNPYSAMLRDTPGVAAFLKDPENAAIAKGDEEQLGAIERMLHYAGNGARAIGSSFFSTNAGLWGMFQAPVDAVSEYITKPVLGEADPLAKLSRRFQDYQRQQEGVKAKVMPNLEGLGFTELNVYQGLESLGQNTLMMLLAALSGGASEVVMLGGMGGVSGGQSYGQAKGQGVPTGQALMFGLSQGLIEIATEKIPVSTLFKGMKGNAGLVKLLTAQLSAEIPGEQVATVLQDLNEWAVLPENATKTFQDYWDERPSAAAATLIATVVGTIGQASVGRVVSKTFLQSAGEAVKNSKTGQVMPDKLREFIAAAAADGPIENVYVSADDIRTYSQDHKLDPEEFLDGVTSEGGRRYRQALEAGADVEIPLADYVTKIANSDAAPFFNDVARVGDPERMSSRDLDAFTAAALEESTPSTSIEESATRVGEDIRGQLQGQGFNPATIDAYAQLYATTFHALGERAGVDPFALYEPYRLKIARPLPAVLASLPNIDTQLDTLIDRLRSGRRPGQAEMFGTSLVEFIREKGGVIDEGGDLASREADKERKPYQKRIINPKGLALDRARELAAEAGYLDPQSSIADFLDKISDELRGAPVFTAAQHNQDAIEQNTVLEQLDAYLKSKDVDLKTASNEEVKKLLQEAAKLPEAGGEGLEQVLRQDAARQALAQGRITDLHLDERGRIAFPKNRKPFTGPVQIDILERGDLSSFLHESGHLYLEIFGDLVEDLATRPDGRTAPQQQMVDDYATVLKWFGVDSRDSIDTPQHEQWARGFEAYLREGKSPSPELRPIFARFRAWLVNIYRSLTQLNVNLTPEVTAVFDRLVASDEQIAQARQEAKLQALAENEEQAKHLGMTPTEYRAYGETVRDARDRQQDQLLGEYMDEYNRAQSEWYAARRREMLENVAREVHQQREYIAMAFLQKGTLPDGSALPAVIQAVKLDKKALEAQYGKASRTAGQGSTVTNKLLELGVYRREGGISPDVVADLFGYSSGDELVQALVNARPMAELLNAETDDRMRETYGDMLTDGTAPEKARDAVMTVGRVEVIKAEIKALEKKVRETAPFVAVGREQVRTEDRAKRNLGIDTVRRFLPSVALARSLAEQRIAGQKIRDIRPGLHYAAARREGLRALEAVNKGNFPAALNAKQKELIQIEMYRAARAAQEESEKIRNYMRTFDERAKRERIGKAGGDYLEQIDALRERFAFARDTNIAIDKKKSLLEWVADRQAEGLPIEIAPELVNEARRQNYREMSLEELRGLKDGVEMIAHLARLKNKLLKARDQREFEAIRTEIVSSIEANLKPGTRDLRTRENAGGKVGDAMRQYAANHRKMSSLVREFDGFKDGGPLWEHFIRPMNESGSREAMMIEAATEKLMTLIRPVLKEGRLGGKGEFFPTVGKSFNREERIAMALNLGNRSNEQRLLDGEGWTRQQIQPILDTLTKADWDFVQAVWDHFETYRPAIGELERKVTGIEPKWLDPTPVSTKHGIYRGGYYSVKYDAQRSAPAEEHAAAEEAKQLLRGAYTAATTRRSFTKERVDEVHGRPLQYSFRGLYQGTTEVIHDLTWREWLIDANRLIKSHDVDQAIRTRYGPEGVQVFKSGIQDIAKSDMGAVNGLEKALNYFRNGATVAGLGWNAVSGLKQLPALGVSAVRIGKGWMARAMVQSLASPKATMDLVNRSDVMQLRAKTQNREINDVRNKVKGQSGARQAIEGSLFWIIGAGQRLVDVPTWVAQYNKSIAAGESEERAIALADQAVIDTQGGGQTKDLAQIQRGHPALKLFTNFYSGFAAQYNISVERVKQAQFTNPFAHPVENAVKAVALGTDFLLINGMQALYAVAIAKWFQDDDEEWATALAREGLSSFLGLLVGVRELEGFAEKLAGIEQYHRGYSGPAGLRILSELDKLGAQIQQGELDRALIRAGINVAGITLHLPSAQVNRTLDGVLAVMDGQAGPAAAVFGPPRQ